MARGGFNKLADDVVLRIANAAGELHGDIAKREGVPTRTVSSIHAGLIYTDVTGIEPLIGAGRWKGMVFTDSQREELLETAVEIL